MVSIFETKAKRIYTAIIANGNNLVDTVNLKDVIDLLIKNHVDFRVDETKSVGIYAVTATKLPCVVPLKEN